MEDRKESEDEESYQDKTEMIRQTQMSGILGDRDKSYAHGHSQTNPQDEPLGSNATLNRFATAGNQIEINDKSSSSSEDKVPFNISDIDGVNIFQGVKNNL